MRATHFRFGTKNLKYFLVPLIVGAGFGLFVGAARGNVGVGMLLGGIAGLAFGAGLTLRRSPSADGERS